MSNHNQQQQQQQQMYTSQAPMMHAPPPPTVCPPPKRTEFSVGLFECFDECGTCCYGMWCPCCLYGDNQRRVKKLNSSSSNCLTYFLVSCCLSLGCVLQATGREKVRNKANIEGSLVEDFLISWICPSCGLMQEKREIDALEREGLL